ncbi:MAG TPA: hypothetical protein VFE25_02320 [Opitutaceae bacterium]|jgi:hypothetical protein|nr:hypothetical protein [Opitutaceae bacterium]
MKSFLEGKKSLSISPLVAASGPTAQPPANGKNGHAHDGPGGVQKANVEIVKEGDKVVRMIVTCKCGERLEIECLYPAGS